MGRMFEACKAAVTWAHPYTVIGNMSGSIILGSKILNLKIYLKEIIKNSFFWHTFAKTEFK